MSRTAVQWLAKPRLPDDHYVASSIYTNETIFQEEREKIFAHTWKFICHESELPKPGDFRTAEHVGKPILVVRDPEGMVQTFYNACPHRGAKLVHEPRGNARNFTCFFHLWSFNTQGECIEMTAPKGFDECGLTPKDCGLRKVKTALKYGMVFINLDDQAEDFDAHVGDIMDTIAEPLGTVPLEVFHIHRVVINCNWKQWHETNMEAYHEWGHVVNRTTGIVAEGYNDMEWVIHPNAHATIKPPKPLEIKYDNYKGFDKRDAKPLPGLTGSEFRVVDLFPNTTVILRATTARIDTCIPVAPGITILEQRGLGILGESAEDRAERVKHHNQYWGPMGRNISEDVLFVEAVNATNRQRTSEYGLLARRQGGKGQDDEVIRAYYRTWGRIMGRMASDPLNPAAV
jgi:methanesulfonate monooxygenase large subunit